MVVFELVNSEAVYSVKLLHFVLETNMALRVDRAVRPRNELLLLIEHQKRAIERQEGIIARQQQMIEQKNREIERQQRTMDRQRQDMAEMQVENICLLGENTALKKRKREDGSHGTCSQWVRHLRTTCLCQVLDCRQIRRLFPVHMHRKELTQCFSYVQHQDRGLARLDYLFCLDRSSWRLFLCLLRFPAFASGCVKINVSKFVLYFFFELW